MIKYSIIAAISDNRVIGSNNKMPWHMPEDLKHFKRLTTGNIIIMGRKTFESIGKALPGRTTIVITGTPEAFISRYGSESLFAYSSLQLALSEAEKMAESKTPAAKVFIAGGASIYAQTIVKAERLYLSRIPGDFEGDAFFPEFTDKQWNLESAEDFDGFRLENYRRK